MTTTDVTLPQLGESVTEGTITRWFKQPGDQIAEDEVLFEISTDKVDSEVPSPASGTVLEILAAEGDTVDVGTVIARIGDPAAAPGVSPGAPAPVAPAPQPVPAPVSPAPQPVSAPVAPAPQPVPAPVAPAPAQGSAGVMAPMVRGILRQNGLTPSDVPGTGANGRITREDAYAAVEASRATSVAPAPETKDVPAPAAAKQAATPSALPAGANGAPLSRIRKITGERTRMSKDTSPHAFSVVEVDYANVERTRRGLRDAWRAREGFSLTYLPFIAAATSRALVEFPNMNASIVGDTIVTHENVNLGIAVDLDYQGLLVPVINSAQDLRVKGFAVKIDALANRARARQLGPDELANGTFTISNNGSAGSVLTAPIIVQPQVAILSTDAIKRRPVVVDGPHGEAIGIHPVGNLAMSWDHRAFDGAYAAGFLCRVRDLLETFDWSIEF